MHDLKPALLSVLSTTPSPQHVRTFVERCVQMAQAYLRQKARHGRLDPSFFGLTLEDLALDCVADLFERDERLRFTQLATYFEPLQPAQMDTAAVALATRRLVFSKVNDGLLRRYREEDPALAKLIRNLRYAIGRVEGAREARRHGQLWVVFGGEEEAAAAPTMGPELLQARLLTLGCAWDDLQDVLRRTGEVLRLDPDYARGYPLISLARLLREHLERIAPAPDPTPAVGRDLEVENVSDFIAASVQALKERMRPTYVGRKKVSVPTFEAYFRAVEDVLRGLYLSDAAPDAAYYDHLQPHVTHLTYEAYRQEHRPRFEYLVKQTRNHFLERITPHW